VIEAERRKFDWYKSRWQNFVIEKQDLTSLMTLVQVNHTKSVVVVTQLATRKLAHPTTPLSGLSSVLAILADST
jgi:hypothetical protein